LEPFTLSRPFDIPISAQAGKIYYFRVRRFGFGGEYQELFDLDTPDSDQARYLIAWYPLSASHQKQ
jgi:hypothetical protein